MAKDHSEAVIRWRDQLDLVGQNLDTLGQSATVSTMLFGCRSWMQHHAQDADPDRLERMRSIDVELTEWLAARGVVFTI